MGRECIFFLTWNKNKADGKIRTRKTVTGSPLWSRTPSVRTSPAAVLGLLLRSGTPPTRYVTSSPLHTSSHPLTHQQGKWTVPKIPNPDYKGPWAPRKIANPAFFEDLHPSDFTKIGGVGIELWTMTEDILCKSFLNLIHVTKCVMY